MIEVSSVVQRPKVRQDLLLQEMGREGLLYDRDGEVLHVLNVTALEVWRACDGDNDLEAIGSVLTTRFSGVTAEQAAGDIADIVAEFDRRGLLESGNDKRSDSESEERPDAGPQRQK